MTTPSTWQAVNDLFDALVGLPATERAAALAAFDGPAEVRREVESLLRAFDSGPVRLDADLLITGLPTGVPAVLLAGRRLGPWAIVSEIGRGGMGAVYEAYRADDQYRQRVAIKTLSRSDDRQAVAKRFQQERQILATLEHPNIATLIDGGVTEEGLPYFVMEYVDGEPIDHYCVSRRLPLRDRLDLFRQVAGAVQFAHRNLVVHRDLKPSNILVTGDGVVKLVDFGIAKILAGPIAADTTLTETGFRAFTTGYASPEQVRGETITTASDTYSLGVVLFLLLAGRLPFVVRELTPTEALRSICEDPPPAPSRVCTDGMAAAVGLARPDQLVRALAGELDDIVLTALRKEPERRYPTVAAFSDDVKRYLQGQQVSARPDTWRYRVRSFRRRNPRLVAALALAAVSLIAGTGVATWQAVRAGAERDHARTEAARSAHVVAFIEQTLATPVQGALTESTIQVLDQAVRAAAVALADDPAARATVYRTAANAYVIHFQAGRAAPLLDSALALDRQFLGARSPEVGRDLTINTRLVFILGRYDSAIVSAHEAVAILREHPSDRPADLPTALQYYAFALAYGGRPKEALPVIEEAIALEATRPRSTLFPYLFVARADAEAFSGQVGTAVESYRRSLRLFDSLAIPDPAERGIAELGLANLLTTNRAFDEAMVHARKAEAIIERRWGPDHIYAGNVRTLLGRLAVTRRDFPTALREIERALAILDRNRVGTTNRSFIEGDYAEVLLSLGRLGDAEVVARRVLGGRRGEQATSALFIGLAERMLGEVFARERRLDSALVHLREAYALFLTSVGPNHGYAVGAAKELLFVSTAAGRPDEARKYAALLRPDTVAAVSARAKRWARRGGPAH